MQSPAPYPEPAEAWLSSRGDLSASLIKEESGAWRADYEKPVIPPVDAYRFLARFRLVIGISSTMSGVSPEQPLKWESPFDDLENSKDRQARFAYLLDYLHGGTKPTLFSRRLVKRINNLWEAAKEEAEITDQPSFESVQGLIRFLQIHPGLKYPDIVLTPSGYFRAEWRLSQSNYFAAEFLPDGDLKFVLFAPNPLRHGKIQRVAGTVSVGQLSEALRSFGFFEWAAE